MRALLLTAIMLGGCVADRGANPFACRSNADCDGGVCVEHFCIAGLDAGGCTRCYTGPPGTDSVGICARGCAAGTDGGAGDAAVRCIGEIVPQIEVCNGVDDDCDGDADEDFALNTRDECGACANACLASDQCCESRTAGAFECANLSSSADHCGACGAPCNTGEACCSEECVDLATDEAHCGGCGTACAPGRECCDGRCIDPRSSNDHCGGCPGAVCDGTDESTCCPSIAVPTDVDCRPVADCATCADCTDPGDLCCAGTCFDTRSDPLNCGGCGVACRADERCCGGSCVALDTACADCTDPCGGSEQCCGEQCIPELDRMNCGGCGVVCNADQACCEDGCVDLDANNSNCGVCGHECGDQVCSEGHCCDAGRVWCGTSCVPLTTEQNCGSCGNACDGLGCSCNGGRCRRLGLPC